MVVTYASNGKWTNPFEKICRKCVRLSFFFKEFSMAVHSCWDYSQIYRMCVIPLIRHSMPSIFDWFLKEAFALLRSPIEFITNVCGLSFSYLTNPVCRRQIKAPSELAHPAWGRIEGEFTHIQMEPFQADSYETAGCSFRTATAEISKSFY